MALPILDTTLITLNVAENDFVNGMFNNATDADGDALTYEIVNGAVNGAVDFDATLGEFTFTPNRNFNGYDSFTYRVSDGSGFSEEATVNVRVTREGTDGDDTLRGNSGNNILNGLEGNDILDGRGGNDRIIAGDGDDTIIGGGGNDTITTQAGNDVVVFTSINHGLDRITDFEVGADKIEINGIFSSLRYDSSDLIGDGIISFKAIANDRSPTGFDTRIDIDIDGRAGNSRFKKLALLKGVDPANLTYDDIFTARTSDVSENLIEGGAGRDKLTGLSGDDTIVGGGDNDRITTGEGEDVVVFTGLNDGMDRVFDFDTDDDLIDVSAVLDALNYDGVDAFGDGVLRWVEFDNQTGVGARLDAQLADGTWQRLVRLDDVMLNSSSDSSFLITDSVV